MSNEIITPKIKLLEAQIEDLEKSGFYTEMEMDSKTSLLRKEIERLKSQLNLYGMTYEEYQERKASHNYYFSRIPSPALKDIWNIFGRNLTANQG